MRVGGVSNKLGVGHGGYDINSWAERFIWLFLGTHLCVSFFIFILFCIFVTSSKIFRAKMEPNIL